MNRYIPRSAETIGEIHAGVADGSLQFWRRDVDGRQWYRETGRAIHGVEPATTINAEDAVTDEPTVDDLLAERAELLQQSRELLDRVQQIDDAIESMQNTGADAADDHQAE